MEFYPMELTPEDASLVINAVNQGIDAHLQAVVNSTFEWVPGTRPLYGTRLSCKVAPNDLGVIIRRLLEISGDDELSLAHSIVDTLGIEEIYLTDDEFCIRKYSNYVDSHFSEYLHISVFDDEWWVDLFNEFDEEE